MSFFEAIQNANDFVNGLVWGPPMLVLIVGTGIFLTILLKFFQISKISLRYLPVKRERKAFFNVTNSD